MVVIIPSSYFLCDTAAYASNCALVLVLKATVSEKGEENTNKNPTDMLFLRQLGVRGRKKKRWQTGENGGGVGGGVKEGNRGQQTDPHI